LDPEVLILSAVLAAALLPLFLFARSHRARQGAVALWVVLSAAGVFGASAYRSATLGPPVLNRPLEVPDGDYVSSDACRACHPGHYDSWYNSWHRTMTQVVTSETVLGDFEVDTLRVGDWSYDLGREGDAFWVEMYDPARGERARFPIVMSTGSHHLQIYWFGSEGAGRRLGMAPFAYLKESQRWAPRSAIFIEPESQDPKNEHGRWNRSCIACHSTAPRPHINDVGMPTEASEFGIACEACHGPGGPHVGEYSSNPLRRYRKHFDDIPDETIVHPARLDKQASVEVCGQCHGFTQFPDDPEDLAQVQREGFSFRPGDRLAETGRVVVRGGEHASDPRVAEAIENYGLELDSMFWSDGMVRVPREYNGLLESACYQRGEMTCLSCHKMHKSQEDPRSVKEWADDQLDVGMRGDAACLQCHESFETRIEAHTNHATESSGSRCQNCHMPYTSYGLLKAIRQHEIDSPTVAATVETGRPNACNACHLDRSLGWAAEKLGEWYGQPIPDLDEQQRTLASGVEWMLTGDAAERALAAWYAGWEPARTASGSWMMPHLAQLLEDPYPAVRYIAWRSLGTMEDLDALDFDFVGPDAHRAEVRDTLWERWNRERRKPGDRASSMLLYPDGSLDRLALGELLRERDDRIVFISE